MKQRTRNILKAAEVVFAGNCYATLRRLGENHIADELMGHCMTTVWPVSLKELRSLYLCFLAAMNETGDLP